MLKQPIFQKLTLIVLLVRRKKHCVLKKIAKAMIRMDISENGFLDIWKVYRKDPEHQDGKLVVSDMDR